MLIIFFFLTAGCFDFFESCIIIVIVIVIIIVIVIVAIDDIDNITFFSKHSGSISGMTRHSIQWVVIKSFFNI